MLSPRPNILLLLADQHRADWTSLNPALADLVRTPNLERLAARGARFTNAICAAPLCGPSRACLASGVEYADCGMIAHEVNWPVERLGSHYRRLRDEAGYHVLGCGKFDLRKATATAAGDADPTGRRHTAEWGFTDAVNIGGKWDAWQVHRTGAPAADPYYRALEEAGLRDAHLADYAGRREQPYANTAPAPLPDPLYIDNWVSATGEALLERIPAGEPWYLTINFSGPHEPLDITARMAASVKERGDFPLPHGDSGEFPAAVHQNIRRNYTAMVENIDARIGAWLACLETRGELENTFIIYAADHGEMLGDRGLWAKSVPFQASAGIPLFISGPGVRRGLVNASPVSLIDLGATFLELAGVPVADDDSKARAARSLLPVLRGETEQIREFARCGLKDWRLAFDGRYKLIRGYGTEPAFLFDLANDPNEMTNLAADLPGISARLEHAL